MTPEARAEKRFPRCRSTGNETTDTFMNTARVYERSGAATIFREQVEPLEAELSRVSHKAEVFDQLDAYGCSSAKIWLDKCNEVAKLRALVQKAVDAIDNWQNGPWIGKETAMHYARGGVSIGDFNRLAKEQGFAPTNTEDK